MHNALAGLRRILPAAGSGSVLHCLKAKKQAGWAGGWGPSSSHSSLGTQPG